MSLGATSGMNLDTTAATQGLALDANSLSSLRAAADRDPQGTVRQAAAQFEALFMQEMLKSMRAAVPKSGLFDGAGTDQYTSMLDSQLAQTLSGRSGGLAEVIARQMNRHLNGGQDPVADPDGMPTQVLRSRPTNGRPASEAGASGVEATGAAATGERPLNPVQTAFVERMWPHARAAEKLTGIPAAYVVGQAALESGWGRRDIRDGQGNPSHNLFGIKATGNWSGPTVATLTTEYVDGEPRKMVEQFRRYESYEAAFVDWARLMTRSQRYAEVLKAGTAAEFAHGLEAAGYATDPRYGDKLTRTIRQAEQVANQTQMNGTSR